MKRKKGNIRLPPKKSKRNKVDIIYLICACWFVFQFVLVLIKFFRVDFGDHWYTNTLFYLFFLIFYSVKNAFNRIKGRIKKKKKGHYFVIAWVLMVVTLTIISLVTRGKYKVPFRALENLIYILSVFAGWNITKILLYWKKKGKSLLRAYVILLFFGKKASRTYCRKRGRKKKNELTTEPPISEEGIPYALLKF